MITLTTPRTFLRLSFKPRFRSEQRVTPLTVKEVNRPQPIVLTQSVLRSIAATVGAHPAETGGPLGGTRGSGVVEHFHADETSANTVVTYYPDVETVNRLLREDWNPSGVNLLGFVHSHPAGAVRPSRPDLQYSSRILAGIPELDRLLLPIVQTVPDTGDFTIRGHAAVRRGIEVEIVDVPIEIVHDSGATSPFDAPEFDRVREAYDLRAMAGARVVAVGCGGSASFLEDMARAGIGEFVLIDPDIVEASNIGTQQAYRTDIGRAKAAVIAERLVAISPHARVWVVRAWLDQIEDQGMRRLVLGPLPGALPQTPSATLLCAFTDNFRAQARLNRLGLHLGVPVLGASVYREGRGVELTFAAQGFTTACIRCAQRSRYVAHLENGYSEEVTSHGTPISATARLNALKLPVAIALLHAVSSKADPDHPATIRHRRLLDAVADRNLVLVSLDPDIASTLGVRQFEAVTANDERGRLPLDTTLWLRQEPDNQDHGYPECPDCGGTGDLATSIGRFIDTRDMPLVFGQHRR